LPSPDRGGLFTGKENGMDKIEKNKDHLSKVAHVLSVIRSVASLLYLLYRIFSE